MQQSIPWRLYLPEMLLLSPLRSSVASAVEPENFGAIVSTPREHITAVEPNREKAAEAQPNADEYVALRGRSQKTGLTIIARRCKAIAAKFADIASCYEAIAVEHTRLAEVR